jgi:hypothetical protein
VSVIEAEPVLVYGRGRRFCDAMPEQGRKQKQENQ